MQYMCPPLFVAAMSLWKGMCAQGTKTVICMHAKYVPGQTYTLSILKCKIAWVEMHVSAASMRQA